MDNSRDPLGPCVVGGCAAPGYVSFTGRPDRGQRLLPRCRAYLEQMLQETGLWWKPEYRALRAALEDDR